MIRNIIESTYYKKYYRKLLYTHAAIVAHAERGHQRMTSDFAEAAQLFEIEVSLK